MADDEKCYNMLDNFRKHRKLVTGGQVSSKAKWQTATLKNSMKKENAVDTVAHGPLMNMRRFCQWASDPPSHVVDTFWIMQSWYWICLFYVFHVGQKNVHVA